MDAHSYINNKISERLNTAVQALLSERATDINSSQAERERFEVHANELRYTQQSQIEVIKKGIFQLWEDYKAPHRSIIDVTSDYESAKITASKSQAEFENQSLLTASALGQEAPTHFKTVTHVADLISPYIQSGETFYAVCHQTEAVKMDRPLINPLTFTVHDIREEIIISPLSNSLHVLESIRNILAFGERVGLTRLAVAKLIKSMIIEYMPQYVGTFYYLNNEPTELFRAAISVVNVPNLLTNIKQAIKAIVRTPDLPIDNPLYKYRSLILEGSKLEQPHLDQVKALKKANKETLRIVKFLIEPNLATEVEKLTKINSTQLDEVTTLEEVITFVVNAESQEQYRPKVSRSLNTQPVAYSIYHNNLLVTDEEINVSLHANDYYDYYTAPKGNTHKRFDPKPGTSRHTAVNIRNPGNYSYNLRKPSESRHILDYNRHRRENDESSPGDKVTSKDSHLLPGGLQNGPSSTGNNASRPPSPSAPRLSQLSLNPQYSQIRTDQGPRPSPSYPRSPSLSPGRSNTSRSPSPIFYRTTKNKFRQLSNSRLYRKSPSRDEFRQRRRSNSGGNTFKPRRPSDGTQRPSTSRGRSPVKKCLLCGAPGHGSRPTSPFLNGREVPANQRNICPIYGAAKVQRSPCKNCAGLNLFHPSILCRHGNPQRDMSRNNSPAFNRSLSPKN